LCRWTDEHHKKSQVATLRAFKHWIPVRIRLGYRPAKEMLATYLSHTRQIMVKLPKIKPQPLSYHFQLITGYHPTIWRYALPQVSIFNPMRPSLAQAVRRPHLKANVRPAYMGIVVDNVALDRFFPTYINIPLYHFTSTPHSLICHRLYIFEKVSAVKRHTLKE